jgi:protein-S-isoprenylcysteine O-methyltransferase Ste14
VHLLLKNLLFTVLVPGTVGGWLPWWLGSRTRPDIATTWRWHHGLALPLFLIGVAIYAWCLWDFMSAGRGTPAPIDPPRRLVVRGLYRYVRNPMYVGVLSAIAGWAAWFAARDVIIYGAFVGVGFDLFVRFVEEPGLRARFGEDYTRYCAAVRRWIPGKPCSTR